MNNCTPDFDVCDCQCHIHPGVKHCRACCDICPLCGQNIKVGHQDDHAKKCHAAEQNLQISANDASWGLCRCTCHQENPGPRKMHLVCGCSWCSYCHFHIMGNMEAHLKNCAAYQLAHSQEPDAQQTLTGADGCACQCHTVDGQGKCPYCHQTYDVTASGIRQHDEVCPVRQYRLRIAEIASVLDEIVRHKAN